MPGMPRFSKRGNKIVFALLGIPPNMQKQKKPRNQDYVNQRLLTEETSRVR